MVMLDDDDCLNHGEWEHNKKIADYLNKAMYKGIVLHFPDSQLQCYCLITKFVANSNQDIADITGLSINEIECL